MKTPYHIDVKVRDILRGQAAYYIGTGLLPLISMSLFERITGKKVDRWLVQMVGLLAAAIGISLLVESLEEKPNSSTVVLSVSSAMSFVSIDLIHVARRRISPMYLGDAAVQLGLLALLANASGA